MQEEKKRNPLLRWFESVSDVVERIEKHVITILTLVFGFILMYNLTLRAFNIQGLTWIEEFSRYMLVVTTLIGCSIAAKHKGHMVMDTLVTALPIRGSHALQAFGYFLCGVMYVYLGYYAWRWTGRLIRMNRSVEAIEFPMWPIWALYTYAVAMMGLRYLVQTVKSIDSAIKGERVVSEQDAEIARALAEEEERKRVLAAADRKGGEAW